MTKKLLVLLVAAVMLSATLAGSAFAEMADAVTVANGDPANFQPVKMTGNAKNPLCLVFEALCDAEFGGDLYGVLAKNWFWEDTDTLVVELYDYIYDSQGNHITASDVVYDYTWCWDNGYTGSKFGKFCDSVEARDDYTVAFHYMEGQADVYKGEFQILTGQFIFSQAAFEASEDAMATIPIGTGPYTLEAYIPGATATLEARDDYWQTDSSAIGAQHVANVKTVTYNFITDSTQTVNALLTGSIDFARDIPLEGVAQFKDHPNYTVQSDYLGKVVGMYPNCLEGCPLNDLNLRLAIFYAVDNETILAVMGGEEYGRTLSTYAVPGLQLYNDAWDTAENYNTVCDMDLAKDYLAKSNYNGETIKIVVGTGTYASSYEAIYMVLIGALEQLGIKYEISQLDDDRLSNLYKTVSDEWDILVLSTGSDGSVIDFVRNSMNTNSYEGGVGNYFDEGLDKVFNTMFSTSGATQENVDALYAYIIDNAYAYGCIDPVIYAVYNNQVITDAHGINYRNLIMPNMFQYVQ